MAADVPTQVILINVYRLLNIVGDPPLMVRWFDLSFGIFQRLQVIVLHHDTHDGAVSLQSAHDFIALSQCPCWQAELEDIQSRDRTDDFKVVVTSDTPRLLKPIEVFRQDQADQINSCHDAIRNFHQMSFG